MKITVKSEEKVGSKNHSAKRFCSTTWVTCRHGASPKGAAEWRSSAPACYAFYSAFKFLSIFFANGSLISLCRGTASITPVLGLIQRECDFPSRFK